MVSALALCGALFSCPVWAQGTTTCVSVGPLGFQGNSASLFPAVSNDGRFVVFQSLASTLVVGDTNGVEDIFLHDRVTGDTSRVSVGPGGVEANGPSYGPEISADGQFVVFYSSATNLIAEDTNLADDVFVHDRVTGTTERVSVGPGGVEANGPSTSPAISADGRFVAFVSAAFNLDSDDTNGVDDVFVHDRVTGLTEWVSVGPGGVEANGPSTSPAVSADGRFVAFVSAAFNLDSADTNGVDDVFVHDRVTGTTERVSVGPGGFQGNDASSSPALSADGRFVAFHSTATTLVTGDTNGWQDVFVHDRVTSTTTRISVGLGGVQSNGPSGSPAFSADGGFVAFVSNATNLVAGDTNLAFDVFVYDRLNATTALVSVGPGGVQGNGNSNAPAVSADGRFVGFHSSATNLVPSDTNEWADAFLNDRETLEPTPRTLTVSVSGTGSGKVTSSPTGINCGTDCTESYAHGTSVVLTQTPTATSAFIGWGGACSGSGGTGPCTVSMTAARSVSATFTNDMSPAPQTLSVTVTGLGTVRSSPAGIQCPTDCSQAYAYNSTVVLTATPPVPLSTFSWGGACSGGETWMDPIPTCTVPMTGALSVSATYNFQPPILTVTNTGSGSGTVTSSPAGIDCGTSCVWSYADDIVVVLTAASGPGSFFSGWSGACSGTGECSVTMTEARSVTSTFTSLTDDEDGDGISDDDEIVNGTDPAAAELYFAEGSLTGVGAGRFETRFSIFNPNPELWVQVTLRFQVEGGGEITDTLPLGPLQRTAIDTSLSYPALQMYSGFSTVIEGRLVGTTTGPKFNIVADRTMTWQRGGLQDGYGSHAETAVRQPATRWYLAEGATFGAFQLYYLLQNPNPAAAQVSIQYIFPNAAPCTVGVTVPGLSRKTLFVNAELVTGCGRGGTDVSAVINADQKIIVERAMYLDDGPGGRPFFYAGHESAGVLEPQGSWRFAEGATGGFFDTYLLVLNQEPIPLDIRLTFLRQGRPNVSVDRQIPANSRNTFALDVLRQFGTGSGQAGLYVVPAEGGVSTVVDVLTAGRRVIAERAMWWPGPTSGPTGPGNPQPLWEEAHVSAGATRTSTLWAVADGEAQGEALTQTYALLSNTSPAATRARVTLALTDAVGAVTTLVRDFCIAPAARETLEFPSPSLGKYTDTTPSTCGRTAVDNFAGAFTDATVRKQFSLTIESLSVDGQPPGELVVERAQYGRDTPTNTPWSGAGGPYWPAGANNLATPLRSPTYPAVGGNYAGIVTMTVPELGETITCPGSTVVTQSGSLVNMAPVDLGGQCDGVSIPLGEMVISTTGAFTTYLSGTMSDPTCGTYNWNGAGGFFGGELRVSMNMVSATCLNINFSMALTR